MNSLFDTDNTGAGFRLRSFQLYNWGTFHKNIVTIRPEGETTLLTGPNGSGKSTLVDAILTLLVPSKKRNYNLASGTERKSSRNPKTYVMGAYGNISDSEEGTKVQYLRPKKENCFSVIIGHFFNRGMNQTLCLAQVFWFSGDDLRTLYVLAGKEITVQDHFQAKENRELRRKLKKESQISVYDTFKEYAAEFSEKLGLQTSRALDLFNQTVAMKSIGNLNEFVRGHMLERQDMRERISELKNNYENLNDCHAQIVKAEKQRDQLIPLREEARKWEKFGEERPLLIRNRENLKFWIAEQKIDLYEKALGREEQRYGVAEDRLKNLQKDISGLESNRSELEAALRANAAFQQLHKLQEAEQQAQANLELKKHRAKAYNALASQLDLPVNPGREQFFESISAAQGEKKRLLQEKRVKEEEATALHKSLVPHEQRQKEIERELTSLKERKNLVPDNQLRLRKKICEALGIEEGALPYVCELVRVKEEEYEWQGAIERVLHNFGLRLIVTDRHYSELTKYVNDTHLQSRLQYHLVRDQHGTAPSPKHRDDLFYKLDIKQDSKFRNWISDQLLTYYAYRCTHDLESAKDAKKALTPSGLVRTGRTLHEKDDRNRIDDTTRYILGWENKEKIAALEIQLDEILGKIQAAENQIEALKQEVKVIEGRTETVNLLLAYTDFNEVDWMSVQARLLKTRASIKELEAESNQLAVIQRQLEKIKKEIAGLRSEESTTNREIGDCEGKTKVLEKELASCRIIVEGMVEVIRTEVFPAITEAASGHLIDSVQMADQVLNDLRDGLTKRIEEIDEKRSKSEVVMTRIMTHFLNHFPEKGTDLRPNMDYYLDFLRFLEKIEQEDLPKHKERFRKLLRKNIVNEISEFDNSLREKEAEIKGRIAKLNRSLSLIEFNKGTLIRLNSQAVQDPEIAEFKRMLRNCIPDVGSENPDENEFIFREIKKLIDRFSTPENERWTRKVTNVLRWLDFSVTEYDQESEAEIERFESSSGKSGGQIVKLAYTILGAAIAYQFGLEAHEVKSKSFRFVVIDEVFNNLDYRNSKYAMDLFKKLDLQLMIVTPADKINVVSEYIATVNIVNRNETTNNSFLAQMTYEEFNKKWKAEQAKLKGKTVEANT
jgi:uncharacterized protein YPO0396